jgi:heavy metal efflux system protein
VLLRKGADADPVLKAIEAKVKEINDHILPKGVTVVPFLDRSDLVHLTTHTVLHNLTEGIILVSSFSFLPRQRARRNHRCHHHSVRLLFASICLDLSHIPANLLSLGALDFGMVVDGAVVMVENIVRHLSHKDETRTAQQKIQLAAHEVQRPVFYAIAIIITAYLPIFTLQSVEGRLFKPLAWTVAFALLGALLFSIIVAPVLASILFSKGAKSGTTRSWSF